MQTDISSFEYLSDVTDRIDELIDRCKVERLKEEKKKLMKEARELSIAYNNHVRLGGNDKQQFLI